MTPRTPRIQVIEVPDLVGVRADHAIARLRERGLVPSTWAAAVDDVTEAGVVLGLDPPASSPVRPRALITLSVAAHPDFRGHADDSLPRQTEKPLELTVTGPGASNGSAISAAERRDDGAQRQERGVQQMELW